MSSETQVNGADGTPLYKNSKASIAERVADLLSRMTLAEKAGTMFHDMSLMLDNPMAQGVLREKPPTKTKIAKLHMNHFNVLGPVNDVREMADWYNSLQSHSLTETRLGIPVTLSTDPRNHFAENIGTSFNAGKLSQWPEMLGLAALRDEALVEKFADVARREYISLGLRCALSPQIDLSTEYRWARVNGGFGEDADLSGRLVRAYIRGFQGDFGAGSVSCVTKHFPGGGPQKDGEDSHFTYGKDQHYPAGQFDYHLRPFREAIKAGTRQIMPYYSRPLGLTGDYAEEVGFAFHKGIITNLLREELGYKGIVLTDWGLITDTIIMGQDMPARAWGCEGLSELERVVKILDAGCDQFGGEARPELVIEAIQKGLVKEARIDESVRKLLAEKFTLGLFDHPFVDVEEAVRVVGCAEFARQGEICQRRSYTLLTNKQTLPLSLSEVTGKKIYVEKVDEKALQEKFGKRKFHLVLDPGEADIALIRLQAPYEPRPGGFEAHFHAGSLEFSAEEKARQHKIYNTVAVSVVDVHLDRPVVLGDIAEEASALLVSYGSSVAAFLDVVFGVDGYGPEGRLPFDLPSSMAAVIASASDAPYDTKDPSFRFGHGLRYEQVEP